jgi:hypothetical protein
MNPITDFNSAYYVLFKIIFTAVVFGLFVFSFLMTRQIQLMNRVLKTTIGPVFSLAGFILVIVSLGLLVMSGLSLVTGS